MNTFYTSVWTGKPNFKTGSGFGIWIPINMWKLYTYKEFENIKVIAGSEIFIFKITDSFWDNCHEIRSKEFGKYLLNNGIKKWGKGKPPSLKIEMIEKNYFKILDIKSPLGADVLRPCL